MDPFAPPPPPPPHFPHSPLPFRGYAFHSHAGRPPSDAAHATLPRDPLGACDDDDLYDSIADLFLGQPQAIKPNGRAAGSSSATTAPPPAPAAPAPAELLILGHLPVLAAAWASQYVRQAASDLGSPVAYLRLQGGYASLEVFGDEHEEAHAAPPAPVTLDDAIAAAAAAASRWIIRVDETDEPALADRAEFSRITVLSGADEAAVVAAYRSLKRLTARRPIDDAPRPALNVAIMGASPERAEAVAAKLSEAIATFLDTPVRVGASSRRIAADGPPRLLFSGRVSETPSLALDLIAAAAPVPPPPARPPIAPRREPEAPRTVDSASAPAASCKGEALARHIAGLTPLDSRCPFARGVEIAADAHRHIHLLALAPSPADVAASIEALIVARAWAKTHAELLGCRAGKGAAPTAHLFTAEPARVRRLVDGPVRLHLLADARRADWVCADLN